MLFKTAECSNFNHPEISFTCDTKIIPIQDIEWLIHYLEKKVEDGTKFKNGETMQLGWMLTKFIQSDEGLLHIFAPNMSDLPIVFNDSITNTLKHFRQQQDIISSCDIAESTDFPSIQSAMIVSESFKDSSNFFLNRDIPEDNLSGWFFRDLATPETTDFELISLYEFGCKRPDLIKYLGLPVGYGVLYKENDIARIIKGESEISVKPGSYLAQLNA